METPLSESPLNSPESPTWLNKPIIWIILSLVLTCFAIYPNLSNDWVSWDDQVYVVQNETIRDFSKEGILKLFDPANRVLDTYTPLTLLSFSADYASFQDDATGYHKTNALLHLINVLLVFLFVYLLNRQVWMAFFVSIFFGIHPMHVESVAWISERKDLLSTLFFLSSCITYLHFLRSSKSKKGKIILLYFLIIMFSLMAMLAKPQAVVIPLIMLVLEFWENKKINASAFFRTIPIFFFSLLFGISALILMDSNEVSYSIAEQILFSGHAIFLYLVKAFFPFFLEPVMGIPNPGASPWYYPITTICGFLILFFSTWFGRKNQVILFGNLFFIFTIILSLHLIKINTGIAYERFTYIPYIGLFISIAGAIQVLLINGRVRLELLKASMVIFLILFVFLSNVQSKVWKNDYAFWTYSIKNHPEIGISYCKRANYYISVSAYEKALADQEKCIALSKNKSDAYNNRGNINKGLRKYDSAIEDYTMAIQYNPNNSLPYACRGVLLLQQGKHASGINDLKTAIQLDPKISAYQLNLGLGYEINEDYDLAKLYYSKAILINPNDYMAWKYRGSLLLYTGDVQAAIPDLEKAINLRPNYGEAWQQLAKANYALNKIQLAKDQLNKAIQLGVSIDETFNEKLNQP